MKRSSASAVKPIGVFDSGLGGLTIVREMRRRLPGESIIYFGDMARLPYGTKSKEQILAYSIQNTLFLLKHKVKAIVVACNSSSSAAYRFLINHFNLPIIDVIEPAVDAALASTRTGRVGVIATQATIDSGAYSRSLEKKIKSAQIYQGSCPLFVPLVEEGWLEGKVTRDIAEIYLRPILKKNIDTLILGCTHYPLLREAIQGVAGKRVKLVDSISPTVQQLETVLEKNQMKNPAKENTREDALKIYVSDKPRNFIRVGEKFLGHKLHHVEVVRQK